MKPSETSFVSPDTFRFTGKKGRETMVRSVVGFAGVAIVAVLALKLVSAILGFGISLIVTLLWLAFWGFVIYLVLRIFAPGLADRMRGVVRGEKSS